MSSGTGPIFVIGSGRSGTTLLRFMLCAHPRIYLTHEASFYVWEAMFPKGRPRREYVDYFLHTTSFRWMRMDPQRVLAGLPDPLPPERIGEFYANVMREKAAVYGRPRWGDKTPSHSAYLPRIYQDFPDAKVVHIVRDPRGTVTSLSRMPWASASLFANALFCDLERKQTARYCDRILRIRLEDLLADPRATMGRVLDFVGEPWDDAVLDHARNIPDQNDMPPLPWLESSKKDRGAPQAQWSSLTPVQIRMIETVTRKIMRECGYEKAKFDKEPSRLKVWTAGLWEVPEMLRCLFVYIKLSKLMRDWHKFDGDEARALFHQVNPGSWARYPGFDLPTPPPLLGSGADKPAA
jgi:hypothetical protein